MSWIALVRTWMYSILRRRELESGLDEEMRFHIDQQTEKYRRAGMSATEARRQALVRFGGVEPIKEWTRDEIRPALLADCVRDVRHGLRVLRRSPGFTISAVTTLALGIGINTVMFSVVNTLLLQPLPYQDPGRLVSVRTVDSARGRVNPTAPPDFYTYRADNRTLDGLDAYYFRPFNLSGGLAPERLPALAVTGTLFTTLGLQPQLGRTLTRADEEWGSHRVALLTHGLWQRRFGGDRSIVGQSIVLNGEPFDVVGILPSGFSFLGIDVQLFVPMAFQPGDHMNSHSNNFLRMIGRLKRGVTGGQAAEDLTAISNAIIAQQSVNRGTSIGVVPLRDAVVGSDVRRALVVLFAAVGFVLLISCANLANLLLARAAVRWREIAVRLALGASRGRLVRQFLVEGLVLSLAGGACGLALAYGSIGALDLVSQSVLPRAAPIALDPFVLLFTCVVAVIAGILLGLAPAGHIAREINAGLSEGARTGSTSASTSRLRTALVIAEVALSLVLLAGAGLMVKSMYRLLHVDSGFTSQGVLTLQINLAAQKYVDLERDQRNLPGAYSRAEAFFAAIVDRVRTVPGVRAVGVVNGLPLGGEIWGKNVTFYDRPLPADVSGLPPIQYRVVVGDYFSALDIRIRSGRAFTDNDTARSPKVAIVNQEMVRRYWEGRDPIGKVISVNPPLQVLPKSVVEEARRAGVIVDGYEPDKFTVVGVADDVRYGGLDRDVQPLVYVPYAQGSEGAMNMSLVVRTDADPLAVAAPIREHIARVDRDQTVANIQTMDAIVASSVARPRLQMNVMGSFAVMAILLAAVGIYGVMAYSVAQRSREIGIRIALGAARSDVAGLVLRHGLMMSGVGVCLGLGGALLLTRALRALLFDVSPTDPVVFVAIVVLMVATAGMAAYLPARRASRLDPIVTLRAE